MRLHGLGQQRQEREHADQHELQKRIALADARGRHMDAGQARIEVARERAGRRERAVPHHERESHEKHVAAENEAHERPRHRTAQAE